MSSALPPSSAPPPASSVPATTRFFTASSAAPSTTEIATSVVTITPSATRSGETPTPIAVISVFTLDSLPVSCSSRWVFYISSGSTVITSGNYAGTVPTGSVSSGYWQSCYPNAPKNPLYSPAICTGQTSVNTIKSAIEGTGSTAATVWSGICCPSGMSYFGRCERAFTTPFTALSPMPIVVTISAESDASLSTDLGWETVTAGRTIRSETVLSSGTLFAEPVTVLWKSSDLSNFPTAYATALAAEMGVMISAEPPPTMSAGAKAGIAVGAVLGLISLFSAIVYYCMRKRRTARQQQNLQDGMAEMPGQSTGLKRMFGGRWRSELDGGGRWRAEMDGESRPTEIDSRRVHVVSGPLAELEAPHHERDEDFAIPTGHR